MQRNLAGRWYHLVVLIHVSGTEVNGNVDYKCYVHWKTKTRITSREKKQSNRNTAREYIFNETLVDNAVERVK